MKKKVFLSNSNDIAQIYLLVQGKELSIAQIADKYSISNTQVRSIRDTIDSYFDDGFLIRRKNVRSWRNAIKIIKQQIKETGSKTTDTNNVILSPLLMKFSEPIFAPGAFASGDGGGLVETPVDSQDIVNQRIQQHVQALIQAITEIVVTEYKEKLQKLTEMEAEIIRLTDENNKMTELLQTEGKKVNYFDYIKSKLQ